MKSGTAVLGVVALAQLLGGAAAKGQGFVVPYIRDAEMPVANWHAAVAPGATGGFGFSAGQASSGLPDVGMYRSISQYSAGGPAAGMVWHASRFTWTPAVRGPIDSLAMTMDVNCFNGGTSNAVAFGFIVMQGGVTYFGPAYTALTNSGWRNDLRYLNLTATSFGTQVSGQHPDFGPTGGVVVFGFYTSNGTGNGTPINSSSGVDNFFVTISTTYQAVEPCGTADIGQQGGVAGPDGQLDNNDFIVYIDAFFSGSGAADYGSQGGYPVPDGQLDNNDFIVFIDRFFGGCG